MGPNKATRSSEGYRMGALRDGDVTTEAETESQRSQAARLDDGGGGKWPEGAAASISWTRQGNGFSRRLQEVVHPGPTGFFF